MTWASDMQAVHDEAAGLVEIILVEQGAVPAILAAALLGEADARRIMLLVRDTLRSIGAAPAALPALCLCCPRPVRDGRFMLAIAQPAREGAEHAIGVAICEACAPDATVARPKVMAGLRGLWPNLRAIQDQQHAAGHA